MTKTLTIAMVLLAAAAVTPAFAQVGPQRFSIPFSFNVDGVGFAAGDYNVTPGPASQTLTVRSLDGNRSAVFVTLGSDWKPGWAATLRFRLVENGYRLESVSIAAPQSEPVSYAQKDGKQYAYVTRTRTGS